MTFTRTTLTRAVAVATFGVATATTALVAPAGASASRPAAPASVKFENGSTAGYLAWKPAQPSAFRVEQATNSAFTQGVKTYKVREPGRGITPYGLASGTPYYFRVRALVNGHYSQWSTTVSVTPTWSASTVRVLSYNSMSASLDGERHPGGTAAPFAQRRAGQLWLLNRSNADVIGIQEAGSCIRKPQGVPCYRQIDSLADGLKPRYRLDERDYTACGKCFNRYTADYIFYDPTVVEPVPGQPEDTWNVGPSGKQARFAAYQLFQVKATGAKFLFISTHILSNRGSNYDQIREQETKSLVSQAKTYASQQNVASIFYAGDFNSYYKEFGLKDLTGTYMRSAGIPDGIDVAQRYIKANYDSVNELYRKPRKGHGSIDHIYATGGIGVQTWGELLHLKSNGEFVQPNPSDHNPNYVDAAIPF